MKKMITIVTDSSEKFSAALVRVGKERGLMIILEEI